MAFSFKGFIKGYVTYYNYYVLKFGLMSWFKVSGVFWTDYKGIVEGNVSIFLFEIFWFTGIFRLLF